MLKLVVVDFSINCLSDYGLPFLGAIIKNAPFFFANYLLADIYYQRLSLYSQFLDVFKVSLLLKENLTKNSY